MRKGGKLGNESARPHFEAAIEVDPNAAFGYIGMGFYYRNTAGREVDAEKRQDLLEKATAMVERALELEPNNAGAHYLMARIHVRANDLYMARIWFDKAQTLNPSFSNIYVGAASEMIYRDETKEAIDDIRHAMPIDPLHPSWFHGQMAWAL